MVKNIGQNQPAAADLATIDEPDPQVDYVPPANVDDIVPNAA
jgi:hypothetical protein